ncbi:MAG TPA: M50 family metallopeptidase [Actinomycetota bacterium]|nr:M50 family metallopeptidase [Actinomycetota bacterium]
MGAGLGIAAFVFLLLLAIFFHELGHFLAARWAGIKVTQFFVGFGPTLWSRRGGRQEVVESADGQIVERPELEYGVKAIPLGGFVKILGMSPFEEVPPQDYARSFQRAPAWKRAIVLAAGSATHILTAFIALVLILSAVGIPTRQTLELEMVSRGSPASESGLRPGDRIVAVDGRKVSEWTQVRNLIRDSPGRQMQLTVANRTGDRRTVGITPRPQQEDGGRRTVGLIGVSSKLANVRVNPAVAAGRSAVVIGQFIGRFVTSTPKLFSAETLGLTKTPGREDERAQSVVGAGRAAADLASKGQVLRFLEFFVYINMAIGLFNLLPIPPLDGGHLLLLGLEKVRRKPVGQTTMVRVMAVGFALLLLLGMWIIFQDIVSPVPLE